jgi:hypothetical protein
MVISNTIHLQYMEVLSQQMGELGGRSFVVHEGKYLIFWISTLRKQCQLGLSRADAIYIHDSPVDGRI